MRQTLAILLFIIFQANALAQQEEYLWPTDASRYLSSTFGETRLAHFHAGLDIKTWGKEGYKVFATKSGVVHRIGVSARGYGKVVYLKHNDGTYSIYAHLQSFEKRIQQVADSIRFKDHRFDLNSNVEDLNIRYEQGEVIGLSGSTGIGPPHLHFELRDSLMRPFNALLTNLAVKDTRPPRISALLVTPLTYSSTINGDHKAKVIRSKWSKEGFYDFGVIQYSDSIGLAIDVFDESDDVTNKYAAYELILIHDQDTLFHSSLDSYDYEHKSDMFIDRAINPSNGRRSFQKLYTPTGMKVGFNHDSHCSCLPDNEEFELSIIAKDYFGNTSVAKVQLIQRNTKNEPSPVFQDEIDLALLESHSWNQDWIRVGNQYLDLSSLPGKKLNTEVFSFNQNENFVIEDSEKRAILSRPPLSGRHKLITPEQNIRIHFYHDTFFDTTTVILTENDELDGFNLYPAHFITKRKFQIQYHLDPKLEHRDKMALYKYYPFRDRWNRISFQRAGSTIHAWNNEFGSYKVIADTVAPAIGDADLYQNESGQWLIRVVVIEEESGLNYKQANLIVNGTRGIAEYDKEDDYLIYYHPDFKPQKSYNISVTVSDYAGNVSTKKITELR